MDNKKLNRPKLVLSKETMRRLDNAELGHVGGGVSTIVCSIIVISITQTIDDDPRPGTLVCEVISKQVCPKK